MQPNHQPLEVPFNKRKIVLLLAGSVLLFSMGVWIVFARPSTEGHHWMNATKLLIAAYGAILLFGLTTIAILKKIFDHTPGLVIDNMGLTDHSGALAAGFISWTDMENISKFQLQGQDFILIQVKNPEFYIERQGSRLKRKGMALNNRLYGTPIFISANTLSVPFHELYLMIQSRFNLAMQGKKMN